MMNIMNLTMPQISSPQRTASTHLKNSFVSIVCSVCFVSDISAKVSIFRKITIFAI
jgi:hypothetical protein